MHDLVGNKKTRAAPGIEPGASRARSENHATRPSSQMLTNTTPQTKSEAPAAGATAEAQPEQANPVSDTEPQAATRREGNSRSDGGRARRYRQARWQLPQNDSRQPSKRSAATFQTTRSNLHDDSQQPSKQFAATFKTIRSNVPNGSQQPSERLAAAHDDGQQLLRRLAAMLKTIGSSSCDD